MEEKAKRGTSMDFYLILWILTKGSIGESKRRARCFNSYSWKIYVSYERGLSAANKSQMGNGGFSATNEHSANGDIEASEFLSSNSHNKAFYPIFECPALLQQSQEVLGMKMLKPRPIAREVLEPNTYLHDTILYILINFMYFSLYVAFWYSYSVLRL